MCIYCERNSSDYRKIYKMHYGEIPVDESGKSYHVHHIDGNHDNNSPDNLEALSEQQHYDRHFEQGDYGACFKLSQMMFISKEEKSKLAKLNCMKRLEKETHPFLNKEFQERMKEINKKRIEEGTHPLQNPENRKKLLIIMKERTLLKEHHFQTEKHKTLLKQIRDEKIQNGTFHLQDKEFHRKEADRRIKNGTHNLLGKNNPVYKLLDNGTHPLLKENRKKVNCPHCNKEGDYIMMKRYHFDNCKLKDV